MKSEKTTATSILVILLIYVFMAGNISGELALCIGANWHIAIEPLIHEHNQNNPHIEQDDSSSPGHEHDNRVDSPHCKPCIDIPIFIGPTDNRLPLEPVKPNSDTLVSHIEPAAISVHQFIIHAVSRRTYFAVDENRFLRSIILLV
jgi:hypothetical protein